MTPVPTVLICPLCHSELSQAADENLLCPKDHKQYAKLDGIWRMLTPEAEQRLSPFIRTYEEVRIAEGRGSEDPEFYRSLPYPSGLSKKWTKHWQLRAKSYESLVTEVLPQIPSRGELNILDLGAGNGWLSNRLSKLGHDVIAVDLQVNDFDGLGCHKYYETRWTAVQAEFDRLPIANGTADLVIFNASLHYSEDLARTLSEARRVLKPSGRIVIIDSPFFHRETAGRKMLLELPYDTGAQLGYLTSRRLSEAASGLDLTAEFSLRPRTAREAAERALRRAYLLREPASMFPVTLTTAE